MIWVYHTQYEAPPVIEQVLDEFNDLPVLADLYPDAIYFEAELTTN